MAYKLQCAVWEFTLKCNLQCTHCGSSAGKARQNELSTEECITLCEDMAELGCADVSLMGGEPFLRSDWYQVSQAIKDLGMNLNFVSNGVALDKYLPKVAQLKPKVVGISLDGMQQAHEAIRGKNTFNRTVKAIELLRKEGIQTTIITTVSKLNFSDLPQLKDLLFKKNVNWQIQIAMPFGNFDRDNMLTREEFYATALFIAKARMKNPFEDLPVIGAHCYGYHSKRLPGCSWDGCSAGISAIGITSDGGIVGCLSMGNNRFIEGNVREKSLKDLWTDPNAFAYNRQFTKESLGPNCEACKHGTQCKGGCNSVSVTSTGKLHNNPYCFYAIENELL